MVTAQRLLLAATFWLFLVTACSSIRPPVTSPAAMPPAGQIAEAPRPADETALAPAQAAVAAVQMPANSTMLDLEESLTVLYGQANPAVVYILVPPTGSGSGFVYSEDGHIVTNNHIVAEGQQFEVVFAGGEQRSARLAGSDPDSDLAVLKVDELPPGVAPLPLADPAGVTVGQFVVAIGNPFGEQGSMSFGIVSAIGRSLPSQRELGTGGAYRLPDVIQTDAPINPGNSGGPLLNLKGEVVGVNSAIATVTGSNSGVGFSIPVQAVWRIVPSLVEAGRHRYAYMGASFAPELTLARMEDYDLPQTQGAYVSGLLAGGPAAAAGLVAANRDSGRGGDLIVAIDGRPVNDFGDLNSYLVFHTRPGQTVAVRLWRDGREIELPMTLGERP
jgi:S1-C subfamily serine protease